MPSQRWEKDAAAREIWVIIPCERHCSCSQCHFGRTHFINNKLLILLYDFSWSNFSVALTFSSKRLMKCRLETLLSFGCNDDLIDWIIPIYFHNMYILWSCCFRIMKISMQIDLFNFNKNALNSLILIVVIWFRLYYAYNQICGFCSFCWNHRGWHAEKT